MNVDMMSTKAISRAQFNLSLFCYGEDNRQNITCICCPLLTGLMHRLKWQNRANWEKVIGFWAGGGGGGGSVAGSKINRKPGSQGVDEIFYTA